MPIVVIKAWREILKVYAWKEKLELRRHSKLGGSGGILPEKIFKFRVSEEPFPEFSVGHFQ